MKVSYMLLNQSELGNGIPSGKAWQWIHCIENEKQLIPILRKVQKIIKENWLTFANFTVDKNNEIERFMGVANDIIRNQIYYDDKLNPERIFYINEDLKSEDEDAGVVILPFCKGRGSRNVMQPWPTAAWV